MKRLQVTNCGAPEDWDEWTPKIIELNLKNYRVEYSRIIGDPYN